MKKKLQYPVIDKRIITKTLKPISIIDKIDNNINKCIGNYNDFLFKSYLYYDREIFTYLSSDNDNLIFDKDEDLYDFCIWSKRH